MKIAYFLIECLGDKEYVFFQPQNTKRFYPPLYMDGAAVISVACPDAFNYNLYMNGHSKLENFNYLNLNNLYDYKKNIQLLREHNEN